MAKKEKPVFKYNARVLSVYDGDSMTLAVDLGFDQWHMKVKCRLYGVNTPELRGDDTAAGLAARDYVRGVLGVSSDIVILSHGKGKYGRWLVDIWTGDGVHLNRRLVALGHAVPYYP